MFKQKWLSLLSLVLYLIIQGTLSFAAFTFFASFMRSHSGTESASLFIAAGIIAIGGVVTLILMLFKKVVAGIKIFFGIEIPLMLMMLFIYASKISSVTFFIFLTLIIIACIAYAYTVIKGKNKQETVSRVQAMALLGGIATSIFIFGIFIFFSPMFLLGLRGFTLGWLMSPMTSIYGITMMALLLSPVYVWLLYVHEYRKLGVELLSLHPTKKKSLIFNMVAAFAVVYVVLLATNTSFILRHPIELRSIDDYKFFYTSQEPEKDIANGLALRNHYLADRDDDFLSRTYCSNSQENCYFGWVQSLFTVYISPFVYQGKLPETSDTADVLLALYENNTSENISIQKLNIELEDKEIFTFDGFASRLRTVSGPRQVLTSEIKSIDVTVFPRPSEKVQNGKMTFIFANPERRQGEAIFDVVLPPDAKITGLTLGRNLENRSYVVPDFAADKVYEDSVRRTIDPAVIKQIGPSTFRIRVFPVFSETTDLRNMQKIAVTYVAPLNGSVIPPVIYTQTGTTLTDKTSKFTVINDDGSNITTDVRDFTKFSQTADSAYACVANKTMTYENSAIFIDISKSAEKSREKYSVLLSHFSDELMVNVYLVNHQISEVPQKISIKQLKSDLGKATFWGHSSEDAWREAMQYRTGGYSNIVILSDNDLYVKEAEKIDLYDFTTLSAANITILSSQIGGLQDAKLVYSAIARRANVLFIDSENNVIPYTTYCDIAQYENSPDATVRAIKEVSDTQSKIMNATAKDNYVLTMKEITKVAQQYHVVALGNSMIAIETEEQRRALEAESGKDSVYDLTNLIGIGLPENNALGLFIVMNAGLILVYVYDKRKSRTLKVND